MTRENREAYLIDKLNEIRKEMFAEFGYLGFLSITVDYNYVNVFSASTTKGGKEIVNVSKFYTADGESRF